MGVIGLGLISILITSLGYRAKKAMLAKAASKEGKTINWELGKGQSSELISNARLAKLQRHHKANSSGILEDRDLIIVWAEEFLDNDLLYNVVKENIEKSVKYLYLLDVRHFSRFNELHAKLKQDVRDEILRGAIDVIFIRSELALNNNVMMKAEMGQQCLYSSIIFEKSPIGWFLQDSYRAILFLNRVRSILANVALNQYHATSANKPPRKLKLELPAIYSPTQYNDFSKFGKEVAESKESPDIYQFDLRDALLKSDLPVDISQLSDQMAMTPDMHNQLLQANEDMRQQLRDVKN